jgi:hypothetical protein
MLYDPGSLDFTLAAAVGENSVLIAELRDAFLESANRHWAALQGARCDGNWQVAAGRLQSLAASFGALELMQLAGDALAGAPGDPVVARAIGEAIAEF